LQKKNCINPFLSDENVVKNYVQKSIFGPVPHFILNQTHHSNWHVFQGSLLGTGFGRFCVL